MSKEKRRVPKLRFPGFAEDWEQRKFGDLFEYERPDAYIVKSDNYNDDFNMPVLTANKAFILGYTNEENSYNKPSIIFDDFTLDRKYVDFPYMLKSSAIKILTSKNQHNLRFLFERLNSTRFELLGHARHYISVVQNTITFCPSVEEEVCISNLLTKFDELITLHQRKLNNLKLKKKALLQKLFPKNGERYPELRFPGFTDAWEQRKLGEIFEYLQNNTLSRDSLNYKNPNIKNIHYGDILVKFDEILDGSNKDIPYINSELDLSKFSKSLLRDGDIVFSDTAEDDAVGKAIELQNVSAPFVLSGLHTIPCRPLIPFGKGYLGNFLNSDSYRMQLRPLVQGIKVSSISKSALKDTMIVYPKKLDEQEKIGGLFYHISKMITLHQRKLDHLQLQKKALLQQMFV